MIITGLLIVDRLLPSYRKQAQNLPLLRAELQKEVRRLVKKYGPSFGPLYYDKNPNTWEQSFRKSMSNSMMQSSGSVTNTKVGTPLRSSADGIVLSSFVDKVD